MSGRVRGRSRAFSLLELVVVLALIGLMSTVAVVRLGAGAEGRRLDEAVRTLERVLIESRVEAMQQARPIAVSVELGDESIRVDGVGDAKVLPVAGLRALDEEGREMERLRVQFGPDGRADGLVLRFAGPGLDVQRAFDLGLLTPLPGVDGEAGSGLGGRLWLVRFDPVSGAPSVDVRGTRN